MSPQQRTKDTQQQQNLDKRFMNEFNQSISQPLTDQEFPQSFLWRIQLGNSDGQRIRRSSIQPWLGQQPKGTQQKPSS
jgi:hypothetical protein